MVTIYTALAIFGMAAVIGLYLLSLMLRNKETPKAVAVVHGLFAVAGLILLIVYCTRHEAGPIESIIVFSIAALGGLVVLYKDLTGKVPKVLGILHGVIALTGFVLLLVFAFM